MTIRTYRALDSKVLAVATDRPHDGPDAWTAYIAAVPGFDHDQEVAEAAAYGSKLHEPIARVIFPEFKGPYVT